MKRTSQPHAPMTQFAEQNGQLVVNQVPFTELCARVGHTPFYAYDRSVVRQTITNLRNTLGSGISLHYAIKCNPMPALLGMMQPLVDGFDVASGIELTAALNAGMAARDISFAGPAKQPHELSMAIAAGITINIESETEFDRIEAISAQLSKPAQVCIRVNPDFELKASGMKMGGGAQQFGIDQERVVPLMSRIDASRCNLRGLHIYTGSQNLSAEAIGQAQSNILQLAATLSEQRSRPFELLNIGGGFGIPYFPGEQRLDLQQVGAQLQGYLKQFQQVFADTEIVVELGRYLVGEAGIFVSRVTDIKQSRDQTFVMVDGGLHHHLAASGNFGQVIRKNYPIAIGNKMEQTPLAPVNVVGPLCTPLDLLGKQVMLPASVEVGDYVVLFQSGAYGYSASPKDFLSHPHPIEVLV